MRLVVALLMAREYGKGWSQGWYLSVSTPYLSTGSILLRCQRAKSQESYPYLLQTRSSSVRSQLSQIQRSREGPLRPPSFPTPEGGLEGGAHEERSQQRARQPGRLCGRALGAPSCPEQTPESLMLACPRTGPSAFLEAVKLAVAGDLRAFVDRTMPQGPQRYPVREVRTRSLTESRARICVVNRSLEMGGPCHLGSPPSGG